MANYHAMDIELAAQEMLRASGAVALPVDLNRILLTYNVELRHARLEDNVSGVLVAKQHETYLIVNESHHINRQRFTIAHELGHFQLHHHGEERLFIDTEMRIYQRVGQPGDATYMSPSSTTTPQEEREANMFAAALLMPAPLIQHAALQHNLWDEFDVASLARTFAVSEQAMSIRLQQLKVVESAISA
ncbi:ImmA/IrrE family metallo-endopeptidase [Paraburkholderia terrae]|uniref:ImmA/IrrE family metallo-endopeptidase n=1 Tax=Paraburkholderia terrae TaxID=311230 RepID=UPI00296A96CE|nr:ImmA/IrrE family metallo-endopeptidase [Paraburkholderia terrae]MDW3660437.1 ImmA/IrrE family metallo-endopeptidase [Paraburkholderia terrae]